MKIRFILYIAFLGYILQGCLYIKQDIGITSYQYDKCKEYFDENGTYHKECNDSDVKLLLEDFLKRFENLTNSIYKNDKKDANKAVSQKYYLDRDKGEIVYKKKRCVCSKKCIRECEVKDLYCLKKCCHEKK